MLAKINRLIAGTLLVLLLPTMAAAADFRAGEQYSRLDKPVASAPAVVEFFSFYCGPCYQFADTYHVELLKRLSVYCGVKNRHSV